MFFAFYSLLILSLILLSLSTFIFAGHILESYGLGDFKIYYIVPPTLFVLSLSILIALFLNTPAGFLPHFENPRAEHSRLVVKGAPVSMGDQIAAQLELSLSDIEHPTDGFHLELACLEDSSDMGPRATYTTVWSESTTISGRKTPDGLEVPISFELPAQLDGVASGSLFSEADPMERLKWRLSAEAEFEDGPVYNVWFDLPVVAPDDEQT